MSGIITSDALIPGVKGVLFWTGDISEDQLVIRYFLVVAENDQVQEVGVGRIRGTIEGEIFLPIECQSVL